MEIDLARMRIEYRFISERCISVVDFAAGQKYAEVAARSVERKPFVVPLLKGAFSPPVYGLC